MTKDRFIKIQTARGYKVTELGKIVTLEMEDEKESYFAMWFFNEDGTVDKSKPSTWKLTKK